MRLKLEISTRVEVTTNRFPGNMILNMGMFTMICSELINIQRCLRDTPRKMARAKLKLMAPVMTPFAASLTVYNLLTATKPHINEYAFVYLNLIIKEVIHAL